MSGDEFPRTRSLRPILSEPSNQLIRNADFTSITLLTHATRQELLEPLGMISRETVNFCRCKRAQVFKAAGHHPGHR
jgi:hypothetical protein